MRVSCLERDRLHFLRERPWRGSYSAACVRIENSKRGGSTKVEPAQEEKPWRGKGSRELHARI
jgi:hypothetical protein